MVQVHSTIDEHNITDNLLQNGIPFSFDGQEFFSSAEPFSLKTAAGEHTVTYDDGQGLQLRCIYERYADSAAAEWTLWLENTADSDSRPIKNILPLDIAIDVPSAPITVSYPRGTTGSIEDFKLKQDRLEEVLRYETCGSRGEVMPFFNLDFGGHGLLVAIGWTLDWFLEIKRTDDKLTLRAGMPSTDFYLHAGEHVRTPRVMLLPWIGDVERSYNLMRRHLIAHHIPKDESGEPYPPICLNTWGGMKTQNHLRLLDYVKQQGLVYDAYWIDAGWYGPDHETHEWQNMIYEDWAYHQGDYRVNRMVHPDTIKPISDAAHALGMKLLLWYDIYNCIQGLSWTVDHPEWGNKPFPIQFGPTPRDASISFINVNHPEAKKWIIDTLLSSMEENGVDYYREDPPPLYGGEDEPGRIGVCAMHAVESLYEIWDMLRARYPRMLIDNCGGGGSRVDLETVSRAYVLWRSDYNCHPDADPIGSQVGNHGLGHFVPLVSCAPPTRPGDDYTFRSGLYGGMGFGLFHVCGFETGKIYPDADYPIEWHRRMLQQYRDIKPCFSGDFYSLANGSTAEDRWMAYEMLREDLGCGVILAFRRKNCPNEMLEITPRLPAGQWQVSNVDTGERQTVTASETAVISVTIKAPQSGSVMLHLTKI